jgi:hypothetical protein
MNNKIFKKIIYSKNNSKIKPLKNKLIEKWIQIALFLFHLKF